MPRNELFLDASYLIALSAPNDQHHARARALAQRMKTAPVTMVTTRAVVLELGNSLARHRYRQRTATLLQTLESDPDVQIVPLSEPLFQAGTQLFQNRTDKEWELTDCISFVVMREWNLTEVLTADAHFEQAGFRALLRES